MARFIRKHVWGAVGASLIIAGLATWTALSRPLGCNMVWIGLICMTVDLLRHHLYVGGAAAIVLAFFFGFLVGQWTATPYETFTPYEYFEQYSLFTWNGRSGELCFKLMLTAERARFEHRWDSKWTGSCGNSKLKQELAQLPRDTKVNWEEWPPRFQFPDPEIADEIIHFAATKGVHVEKNPVLQ